MNAFIAWGPARVLVQPGYVDRRHPVDGSLDSRSEDILTRAPPERLGGIGPDADATFGFLATPPCAPRLYWRRFPESVPVPIPTPYPHTSKWSIHPHPTWP